MMGLFGLVKEVLSALEEEDEFHLAFIFGYRMDTNKFRHAKHLLSEGVFLRSLIFFKQVFFRLGAKPRNSAATTYLLYAGTDNQFRAMLSTWRSLQEQNLPCDFICDYAVRCPESRDIGGLQTVAFSLREALAAVVLFALRARSVLRRLKAAGNDVARVKYFDKFSQAYIYLPYFYLLLRARRPDFIVMSNDHSTPNRSLRLMAQRLGIKTVFMQHGSGNALLPPLDYDFALLDGLESVEKYLRCAENAEEVGEPAVSDRTTVILGGLKRLIPVVETESADPVVGVAVNPHDHLDDIVSLLSFLIRKGIACIVRAHPVQEESDILALTRLCSEHDRLRLSVFNEEPVGAFLSRCSLLVAGDSSVHLEAVLARVPTYYYRFSDSGLPYDYLHHVRGGIALEFPANFETLELQDFQAMSTMTESMKKAIRQFSESFGTEWEGREGELVVQTLMLLSANDADLSDLYHCCDDNRGYKAIFRLDSPAR